MRYKLLFIILLITLCACSSLGDKHPVASIERDSMPCSQPDCEAQEVAQEKSPEEAYAQNRSTASAVADAGLWLIEAIISDPAAYQWLELLKGIK